MRYMPWVLAFVFLLFTDGSLAQQRPDALQKMEDYRGSIMTGYVEWSRQDYDDSAGWRRGVLMYRTSKIADETVLMVNRGDENGIVVRDSNGDATAEDCHTPTYRITTDQGVWEKMDADMQPLRNALMFEGGHAGVPDPRSFGATSSRYIPDIHQSLWRDPHTSPTKWRYEEKRDGDLYVVKILKGNETTTYWIDPKQGWAPVRVRSEYEKSGSWRESRSILKEMDGVWMPETVRYFDGKHEGGQTPVMVVNVYEATFNRPEHPRQLTLADIGIDAGAVVTKVPVEGPHFCGRWNGEEIIPVEQAATHYVEEGPLFKREVRRYKEKQVQKLLAELDRDARNNQDNLDPVELRKSVLQNPRQCESLWETYTRQFIKKYKLNEEQTQKALTVLKHCQDRGQAHLGAHREEFAKYDGIMKKLGPASHALRNTKDSKQEREAGANSQLQELRDKLIRPLEDIFEKQLVPRLDQIPTRMQRKEASLREMKIE